MDKLQRIRQLLCDSASTGRMFTIRYGGGSRPGQPRVLQVTSCNRNYLRVIEKGTKFEKTYKLSKIIWIEDDAGTHVKNPYAHRVDMNVKAVNLPLAEGLPQLDTLQEYITLLSLEFQAAGWHLHTGEQEFGVGRYFKNGKPMKTPSVCISFHDRSIVEYYDGTSDLPIVFKKRLTGRERPWRVDSWRFRWADTFGEIFHAMCLFVSEVRNSTPETAKGMFAGQ